MTTDQQFSRIKDKKKTDRFDNNSKSVYLKRNFDILKHMN